MTPIVFGPSSRRLVGLYHPAEKTLPTPAAVLMCYPFGHEAMRIHRLYRVLADRLARQGVGVLRFDYFATGDSPGDDVEGEMRGWRADLLQAHAELRRRSLVDRISWLGSRLGAALAVEAAPEVSDLKRLVLWDPIVDGPAYVRELRTEHAATVDASFYARHKSRRVAHPERAKAPLTEAIGFAVGNELARQLVELSGERLNVPPGVDAVVFASPSDRAAARWCATQTEARRSIRLELFDHPIVWTSDPLANSAIVPSEVTQRLLPLFHEAS